MVTAHWTVSSLKAVGPDLAYKSKELGGTVQQFWKVCMALAAGEHMIPGAQDLRQECWVVMG